MSEERHILTCASCGKSVAIGGIVLPMLASITFVNDKDGRDEFAGISGVFICNTCFVPFALLEQRMIDLPGGTKLHAPFGLA